MNFKSIFKPEISEGDKKSFDIINKSAENGTLPKSAKAWENYIKHLDGASDSLKKFLQSEEYGEKTIENFNLFLKKQNGGLKGLKNTAISVCKSLASFGLNMLIDAGITLVTSWVMKAINAKAEAIEKIREDVQTSLDEAKEATQTADSLLDLKNEFDAGTKSSQELESAFYTQMEAMGKTRKEIEETIKAYGGLENAMAGVTGESLSEAYDKAMHSYNRASGALKDNYDSYDKFIVEGDTSDLVLSNFERSARNFASVVGSSSFDDYSKSYEVWDEERRYTKQEYNRVREAADLLVDYSDPSDLKSKLTNFGFDDTTYALKKGKNATVDDIVTYYNKIGAAIDILAKGGLDSSNDTMVARLGEVEDLLAEDIRPYLEAKNTLDKARAKYWAHRKLSTLETQEEYNDYMKWLNDEGEKSHLNAGYANYDKDSFEAYYEAIVSMSKPEFLKGYQALQNTKGESGIKTLPIADLKEAVESLEPLSKALKEVSDDGYITAETMLKIKGATGLTGDAWDSYQSKLMNAKVGSAEFNQTIDDLTYKMLENTFSSIGLQNATEEQIAAVLRESDVLNHEAKSHEYAARAKFRGKIASETFENVTEDSIKVLLSECSTINLTEKQMLSLITSEIRFNRNNLDVDQKVEALKEVMVAAGMARSEVDALFGGISNQSSGTDKKNYFGQHEDWEIIGLDHEGENWSYNGENLYSWAYLNKKTGAVYDAAEDAKFEINAQITQDKLDSMADFTAIKYNTDSGSGKNEALDNYLKDAENRYKIHQDETKYIEELQYAYHNLAKEEKEQLDIEGKINEAYRDRADNRIKDLEHQIDLKKELYGEDYDATAEWTEIQNIAHEEANRYREFARKRLGYYDEGTTDEQKAEIDATIEKTDEIQGNQKTWWGAQNKKLDFYQKQHDATIKDIEHARDMALNADENANVNAYYRQLQDEYHKEAERLRALDPEKYKEDIQKLQQLWWDAQQEMLDYNKQVIDDFLSKLQEELDKSFDIRISRLNSQSSLLSSHFDIVNAIAEEQHNLNKELREAETIGVRMSEQERETLFSKADHNKLSSKLSDIMLDITDLQSDYLRDLERATEDTIEEVTNQYERQYELKMKEYEIVKAELNLIRKQQILENTQNEKSVRTWNGSEWVYEANLQDVLNAQEEVENAKYELERSKAEEAQQTALNAIDASADALQTEKNKLTTVIEEMAESMNGSGKEITDMLQTIAETDLPAFQTIIQSFGDSIKDFIGDSEIISLMKSNSEAWHTTSGAERDALVAANAIYADMLGLVFEESTGRWKKPNGTYAYGKYASGTNNAKKGIGLFDEKGFGSEVILTNDGILTQFDGGERVFSPEMADRLWEMAQKNNILTTSVPQPDFSKLVPIEERINNAISNISNSFGDTYMIKDVRLSESEGGTLKGFINFLKKKI